MLCCFSAAAAGPRRLFAGVLTGHTVCDAEGICCARAVNSRHRRCLLYRARAVRRDDGRAVPAVGAIIGSAPQCALGPAFGAARLRGRGRRSMPLRRPQSTLFRRAMAETQALHGFLLASRAAEGGVDGRRPLNRCNLSSSE